MPNFFGPRFSPPAGAGATPPGFNYTAQTGTYAAVIGDFVRVTSGTFTITLPTAVSVAGQCITIVNAGTGVITIATTSSQTIHLGSALASGVIKMGTIGDKLIVTSDGANWVVASFEVFIGSKANTSTTSISGTTLLIFGTEEFDPQGDYDNTTGLYTCSIPGTYMITGAAYGAATWTLSTADLVQVFVFKNGGSSQEIVHRTVTGQQNTTFEATANVKLAAGDTASLRYATNGTTPSVSTNRCYIQIVRIGS